MSKEILTAAAKAAGYDIRWKEGFCKGGPFEGAFIGDQPWNPLTDDGDALRLAVKLHMDVDCVLGSQMVEFFVDGGIRYMEIDITDADPYAATRRAIVRAAAGMA